MYKKSFRAQSFDFYTLAPLRSRKFYWRGSLLMISFRSSKECLTKLEAWYHCLEVMKIYFQYWHCKTCMNNETVVFFKNFISTDDHIRRETASIENKFSSLLNDDNMLWFFVTLIDNLLETWNFNLWLQSYME